MAKRAKETFVVATEAGKLRFDRDAVVPADIAKGRDALVYDDGSTKKTEQKDPYVRTPFPGVEAGEEV